MPQEIWLSGSSQRLLLPIGLFFAEVEEEAGVGGQVGVGVLDRFDDAFLDAFAEGLVDAVAVDVVMLGAWCVCVALISTCSGGMPVVRWTSARARSTKSRVMNSTSTAATTTFACPGFSMTTAVTRSWPSCPVALPGPMPPAMTIESSASRLTAAAPTRKSDADCKARRQQEQREKHGESGASFSAAYLELLPSARV